MRDLFATSCLLLLPLSSYTQEIDPNDQELADAMARADLTTPPPDGAAGADEDEEAPAPPAPAVRVPNEDYLDDKQQDDLEKALGKDIKDRFVECIGNVVYCKVVDYVERFLKQVNFLDKHFKAYPRAGFRKTECTEYWQLVEHDLQNLRNYCEADNDFPPVCQQLTLEVPDYIINTQIFTLCSLIEPGNSYQRLPTCFDITTLMLREEHTLTQCPPLGKAGLSKTECVDYFCDFYSTFRHRIMPWNMLNEEGKDVYADADGLLHKSLANIRGLKNDVLAEAFVLKGCEKILETNFDREQCPLYRDINGYCDCLCQKIPELTLPDLDDLTLPDTTWCDAPTDAYLMFGRLGVENINLDPKCEYPVCKLFDRIRTLPQCAYLELPGRENCKSMQLPYVAFDKNACPWLEHSGEDHVLVCNNGYRCNVQLEGWACCAIRHRGRASCPRNLPVMCDIKCGNTPAEYCCDEPGKCRPLGCSPSLLPYPVFPTTTNRPTLDPARFKKAVAEEGESWKPPPGFWVWIFILVPALMFLYFLRRWNKARSKTYPDPLTIPGAKGRDDVHFDEQEDLSGENSHKYLAIRASGRLVRHIKAPPTVLEVHHLLSDGSLGLELQETTVTHVKDEVKVFGWRYGDKITEVNGYPVLTFEALWTRFLGARNALPVKFTIMRKDFYVHADLPQEIESGTMQPQFVNAKPQRVGADGEAEEGKKVAIDPVNERADFLRMISHDEPSHPDQGDHHLTRSSINDSYGSAPSGGWQKKKGNRAFGKQQAPWQQSSSSGENQGTAVHFDNAPPPERLEKVKFVKDAYGRPVACTYPEPTR